MHLPALANLKNQVSVQPIHVLLRVHFYVDIMKVLA